MTQVEIERETVIGPDGEARRITRVLGEVPTETDALFVNWSISGVSQYRTSAPAAELKASMFMRDGHGHVLSQVGRQDQPVVIYSMPREVPMYADIAELMKNGVKVIADVDDYLPAFIGKEDHKNAHKYTPEWVQAHLDCVAACDLAVCSTEFIAERIGALGVPTFVIPNALSLDRWQGYAPANTMLNRAQRRALGQRGADKVIIGWSGSTGHGKAFDTIVPQLNRVLRENKHAHFCSIGDDMGSKLAEDVQQRVIRLGFVPFPDHPQVLTQFQISVGPTLDDDFYRAKSDLRCLEAWASSSAFVGGHTTYGQLINHREDGFSCHTPDDYYSALTLLVNDPTLRLRVANAGRNRLLEERTIDKVAPLWKEAIELAKGL